MATVGRETQTEPQNKVRSMISMPRGLSLTDRFWRHVVRNETGCWGWIGSQAPYGEMRVRGMTKILAHRFAWELANGPIPAGMRVLHHCDNPPCTRPDHLFLGTQRDNLRDAAQKGRTRMPDSARDKNPAAKLTTDLVHELRARHAAGGISYSAMARELGVNKSTVARAIRGLRWQ